MKRNLYLLLVIISVLLGCGCNSESTRNNEIDENFIVNSVKWGTPWIDVKDELTSYKIINEDSNRTIIEIDNYEYLDINGKLMMEFSSSEENFPETGFINAYFVYDVEDEESLIQNGEKIYGIRKDYFLDKNGIENPLNPLAWYSNVTIENSLSQKEREDYIDILRKKNYEDTRIDAVLRGPLVIISVDEEKHMIKIQGSSAAAVANIDR